MARLTKFHLGEWGSYSNSGYDYDYIFDGQKASITVRIDSKSEEDALTLDVDEEFSRRLEALFEKYNLKKWDGFHGNDKNVLDGDSFGFSAKFDDGSSISAGGYMKYPKHYADAAGEVAGLFLPVFESVRPDRRKVMKNYFNEIILKDCEEFTKIEAGCDYYSDGGNMFHIGKCDISGGAHMSVVYSAEDEPEYMVVTYLAENPENSNAWALICEAYRITEKGEVLEWGSVEIDPNLFNCDRLYGHIFTRLYNGQLQLGCFTQKGFAASGRDTIFYIDLYDIGSKLEPLANEKVEGNTRDKESWSLERIQNFVEVADKFGFTESKRYWTERPNDPVLAGGMKDNANHRIDFLFSNNHDNKFYNTLINTPKGEIVQGYRIHGKIYAH